MASKSIEDTIVSFLDGWDRQQWMIDHGKELEEQREAYSDALDTLREAVSRASNPERGVCQVEMDEILTAAEKLREAAGELEGQILPDDWDYIADDLIDPDGVAQKGAVIPGVDRVTTGFDCREGWRAMRLGKDLYVNWWRDAWGGRHERDLYVLVERDFFEQEAEAEMRDEEIA